jgi:pimeloyl-ACP methyl ester carboxylesterase
VRRCFVTVAGTRQVHYRRHGSGPPLVLLHESPQTSVGFVPLMEELGDRFTTIAFDTPGFGLSDPLPLVRPEIADYADATAEAIVALGLGGIPVPVYGNHTGALIALELTRRAPAAVAVAILDGIPVFGEEEAADLAAHYTPSLAPAFDGSHLLLAWARDRGSFTHFPWYRPDIAHRIDLPMASPAELHRRVLNVLRVSDRYERSYQAAFRYRPLAVLAEAQAPLALVCRTDDLQTSRQARLPASHASEILPQDRWLARIAEVALAHSTAAAAPPESVPAGIPGRITRAYVDTPAGQLLVRRAGPAAAPAPAAAAAVAPAAPAPAAPAPAPAPARPIVLVHGSPGGARLLEPLLAALGATGPALAIDLPGYGDSDPPPWSAPTVGDFADVLGAALDALGLTRVDLYGTGSGAAIAAELAIRRPGLVGALAVDAIEVDGSALTGQLAPALLDERFVSLEPSFDGAHLLRAWAMVTDASRWSPWVDRIPAARIDRDWSVQELHDRTVDLLLSGPTYPLALRAALLYPLRERLALVPAPTLVDGDAEPPRQPDAAAARAAALRAWLATSA